MPDFPEYPIDPEHQARTKELEELQVRGSTYFAKTRAIFLNEDDMNGLFHDKPRKAAERMRCLSIYLCITATCYERIAELKKLIEKGKPNAIINTDSSSGKADGTTGGNVVPVDIRTAKVRKISTRSNNL